MKSFLRESLITIALAVVIFLGARTTIQTYEVFQSCMEPNFYEGDRVVVIKAVYWFGDPDRGDVIILDAPDGNGDFIKRVIGLPGDRVEIKDRAVYINGTALDEPYVQSNARYEMDEITVPEASYFVMGDNRNNANDSHNGWYATRDSIHGRAWLISWPPENWGLIPSYDVSDQLTAAETG